MTSASGKRRLRSGGLATWSIHHRIGVTMIAAAVVVLGAFALDRLAIDLLPHIIYPEVRIRIIDPGVPATVMEDRITRQLEEQLAITEDAISVQSRTSEGRSAVDLSFEYGKDIDIALRDASTRLDRAKRFLPNTIDPPIIFKRDPSQRPVLEFVVNSPLQGPVELRNWVDHVFAKWFVNLPGVAAVEVGGGLVREIHVMPDQQRLSALGLRLQDLVDALDRGNVEAPAGRLMLSRQELLGRTAGRLESVADIANLPLRLSSGDVIRLSEVAQVIDTHEDERIRVRYNNIPGVKVSIQKQPAANTVDVVDHVRTRLAWLVEQRQLPEDVEVHSVGDQSVYIRNAIRNASSAAASGALLAMLVVYLFLGNLRRTLIIGSAIPIAIMVTFVLMALGGLTLNIMTLGGLALGVGMLVDNTIVMLENIYRRQQLESGASSGAAQRGAVTAAEEVNSAIVASTSTNLAAVLPFLFIGGLVGLLFRELIITISAAIVASMIVALTLVPALASRTLTYAKSGVRVRIDQFTAWLQRGYGRAIGFTLRIRAARWLLFAVFVAGLWMAWQNVFTSQRQVFLPNLDDGQIRMSISADPGISLNEMDSAVRRIESMLRKQDEVQGVFSLVGGFIFGRSEYERSNKSTLSVQLVPRAQRDIGTNEWIKRTRKQIAQLKLAGIKVRLRAAGIRGIRTSRGDDDISLRIQGQDLTTLEILGHELVNRLEGIDGLRNLVHSAEDTRQEISIVVDRERATALGLDIEDVGQAMNVALAGRIVTDFLEGDRSYDVRLRLPRTAADNLQDLESILLFSRDADRPAVHLGDVAEIRLIPTPAEILRDRQNRIVEVSASVNVSDATLGEVLSTIETRLADMQLPPGYSMYDGGERETLEENKRLTRTLLGLALFLVFVVMAVQYESLRNPIVIMLSVPFAAIGVAIGIELADLPLSMPVWLGMIMLAGIVVNNAIVLVEYIEIIRDRGRPLHQAIAEAAALRLRPILMTTLTTVVGMLPLALNVGDGAEILQPLAVTIVAGLSFSMLVSLLLVPLLYQGIHRGESATAEIAASESH